MDVRLKLRFWNANYVGTQFGGSIFAMTDLPGRTDLTATFQLSEEDLATIRQTVQEKGRMEWVRQVQVLDASGEFVAEVEKVISIKKRG